MTHFVLSAPYISNLFQDKGLEVAFAGCSNVGKSSALNTLTNQPNLARTSKKPGCTQLINVFEVEPGIRLIDLPGYGYAKVPLGLKNQWQYLVSQYLQKSDGLKGIVVLIDIRHAIKDLDKHMVQFAIDLHLPILMLLTKADKMNACACKTQLHNVRKNMLVFNSDIEVEIFSSLKKLGVNKLSKKLDSWFSTESKLYHQT